MKSKLTGIYLLLFALIFSGGLAFASAAQEVPSSLMYQAVNKYKNKDYTGCAQDMDYVIKNSKPTDIAYYYKALSYAQLGMIDEARSAYETARSMSTNRALIDYSTQAIEAIDCMNGGDGCSSSSGDPNAEGAVSDDITNFIKSEEFLHDDVKKNLQSKTIERAKSEINNGKKPTEKDLKYLNNNDNMPTDKEIADAVRTFSKLGINPITPMYSNAAMYGMGQNAELAQMSAFLNGQNNNRNGYDMMNMIPMLSAMQSSDGKSGLNKEFIQTMMMNQMLPSFNFGNSDK